MNMTIAVESQFKQLRSSPNKRFSGLQQDLNQLPLHSRCSALPAELRRPIHWELANLSNCDSAAMVTYSFHLYSCSSHHFILCFIPFTGWWTQLAGSQCMGPLSSAGRVLQRKCRGHGIESRWSPEKLFFGLLCSCLNCDSTAMVTYSFQKYHFYN